MFFLLSRSDVTTSLSLLLLPERVARACANASCSRSAVSFFLFLGTRDAKAMGTCRQLPDIFIGCVRPGVCSARDVTGVTVTV